MSGKRKIFVIYHRGGDQDFYDDFSAAFGDIYDIVQDDPTVAGGITEGPEDAVPGMRKNLVCSSCCAVVLCGPDTPTDARVDWAIKACLDERRGLIGVNLPNSRPDSRGFVRVPERLHHNIVSGYAMWLEWTKLLEAPLSMGAYIAIADRNARKPDLVKNDAPPMPDVSV